MGLEKTALTIILIIYNVHEILFGWSHQGIQWVGYV
jgi:hypothetical protein